MQISGNPIAHYHQQFNTFQKQLSQRHIEAYEASGKSFEKLKEEMGVEELTFHMPPPITHVALMRGTDMFRMNKDAYTYRESPKVDIEDNAVNLTPGMVIPFDAGVQLHIEDDHVRVAYTKSVSDTLAESAQDTAHALDRLIKYANGQNGAFGFDTETRKLAESVLKRLGLRTNETLRINGTAFETAAYDRLEKKGVTNLNFTMLPEYQMKQLYESYGFVFDE